MYFMARCAAFKTNRGVLKRERTSLVSVTLQTAGFIGRENLCHRRPNTSVRIVTIHAAHRPFGQFMGKRFLKLRPCGYMTGSALCVDIRSLSHHHAERPVSVYLVARCAGDLVFGVAAL